MYCQSYQKIKKMKKLTKCLKKHENFGTYTLEFSKKKNFFGNVPSIVPKN